MESGSSGTLPSFNASRREVVWDAFVGNTTECADTTQGSTFACMRNATTSDLLSSWETVAAAFPELFLFVPVIDGPNGLLPDLPSKLLAAGHFSKIPFMAGTVLDEGTDFVPEQISTDEQLVEFIVEADNPFAPSLSPQFQKDVATLLTLYPDNPALGSPFGTGNETFGLSSEYKRASALLGDASFQATRREWIQAATAAGVTTFGYIFTDQNAALADPATGGASAFWRSASRSSWADVVLPLSSQCTMLPRFRTCTGLPPSRRLMWRAVWWRWLWWTIGCRSP